MLRFIRIVKAEKRYPGDSWQTLSYKEAVMKNFSEKVILAGHRGERTVVPENTLAAFRYALSCGVDAIETDFHLSKDGELVVIHDHTLERTTDGHGRVCDHTLAELRALSAGGWLSAQFATERIPTADEFFQLTADTGILYNLELKVYPADEGEARAYEAVQKLVAMLEKYRIADGRVMLSSWSLSVLAYVRKTYGSRFLLQGFYPLANFKDGEGVDAFSCMDYACLFPISGSGHVCPQADYEALKAHGVVPCNHIPAVYTDYEKALGFGSRMFTVDDIKTSECLLRAFGAR